MRLKLYISGLEVETYPDQSLQLTREIYTKENVASTDIAYSQQISIPASERNQRLFDYVHLLDYWEKPSPHLPISGIASIEDGTDLKVVIEIRGFTFERAIIKTYQIAFYIYAAELFSKFSNDNLADVDFSAFDFAMNQANVIASWEIGGPDYFCPVMAHSKPFYYIITPTHENLGDIAAIETGVELSDCKPSYLLTKLVETIFTFYGITITWGDKIANHLAEAFILPSKAAGGLEFTQEYADTYFEGERHTNFGYTGLKQILEMESEISDNGNVWYDQKYHAPNTGKYTFYVHINSVVFNSVGIGFRVNGGAWDTEAYTGKLVARTFAVNLTAGDVVEFEVNGTPGVHNEGAVIKCTEFAGFPYAAPIIASMQMPEMTVSEFIKGFLAAFKLTLLQIGVNTYKIYDTRSIYADGTIRDWSKYVDMKVMSYQKRNSFKRLVLSHADTEDEYNKVFKAANDGKAYGSVNYDTGLTFGTNEITMQSIFSVFPPVFLGRQNEAGISNVDPTNLLLHQQINEAGEPVVSKFLLFYRNGSDGSNPYWLQDGVDSGGPTFSLMSSFGYYSQNQDKNCNIDVPALHYGFENPAYGIPTEDIMVYEFWRDTLEIFINNSAFQLTSIPFRPPASEMAAFKINDTILVNGIYHIPTKAVYDYMNDLIKLDIIIYHPTYAATMPVIASGSGEVKNPLDVKQETMHTMGARRIGDRMYKIVVKDIWKPKKLS